MYFVLVVMRIQTHVLDEKYYQKPILEEGFNFVTNSFRA